MNKPDIVRAWCEQRVGNPYIYGGTGQPCTPAYRKARMNQYPASAEKIKRNCPRLTGKADSCVDCKWCDPETEQGKDAYDCAQFSRFAMAAVGISLVSGANSQWENTDWAFRGKIDGGFPNGEVCLVFRWDDDHMGHVGVYQGDGTVIHAKGHDYGVVRQRIEDVNFTHWGQPKGLYTEDSMSVTHPTLRKGDSGPDVVYLQTLLCSVGDPITVDGKFGSGTEKAVKEFQTQYGLTADGVVGPQTWDALEKATGHHDSIPGDGAIKPPNDDIVINRSDWNAIRAAAAVLTQAVKKYESVG